MGKRKNQPLIDSDSESDSAVSESELLSLAKKKKTGRLASTSPKNSGDSDSSDWGSSANEKKVTKNNKASSIDEDDDDEEATAAPPPQQSKPIKVVADEPKHDSEPEEGEVSDSESGGSGSSSDDDSSSSEFNDGYDENLMGDEEDRKRLEGLSEKERETELYKRIERREMLRTRWEIERKLRMARKADNQENKKPKSKKKKKKKTMERTEPVRMDVTPISPTLDLPPPTTESPDKKTDTSGGSQEYFDPKERSKERKKNVEASKSDDKRSNAMAMLKARREGKAKREEEEAKKEAAKAKQEEEKEELEGVAGGKSSVKLKASDIYSDDSGSESDDKASERRSTTSSKSSSESEDEEKVEKPIAHITTNAELNKLRLSRFKMERFINLPHFDKVVNNCFVRVSVGNSQGAPVYRIGQIIGVVETAKVYQFGKARTNKGLRLRQGTQDRVFRLEFISNQDFTEQEFLKWKKTCESQNVPLPTVDLIELKQKDVKDALYYEFKDEDIDRIIEEKQRFRAYPTNYAMKKTQLMKDREAAITAGDDDFVKDLNIQIQELEERANELDKKRSSSISLISYINNRNRKRNVEDAEKAILEEAKANKGVKIDDPFTRRSTQPTMLFKKNNKAEEPTQLPEPIPPPSSKKKVDDKKNQNGPPDNNLYSLHDFEIDLDVPLPLPVASVNVVPKPVEKIKESGPKRSLNLEDYKKKRGLI